jgi:hypothetical protein
MKENVREIVTYLVHRQPCGDSLLPATRAIVLAGRQVAAAVWARNGNMIGDSAHAKFGGSFPNKSIV